MFKLLKRKEVWRPTGMGWVCLFILAIAVAALLFKSIYPFLHINDRIDSDVLVVEGWVDDDAIEKVVEVFRDGDYRLIIATGIPLTHGAALLPYDNYAEMTRLRLLEANLSGDQVLLAAAPDARRNRTRAMAVALKRFLDDNSIADHGVNIFTQGPHARRSRDIYRDVLVPEYAVGVVAVDPGTYKPSEWWTCSEGVKSVLSEGFAYVYNVAFTVANKPSMRIFSIYLGGCLLGYLLGAVPFGFVLGKLRGVDVHRVGSGNIGATNVFRTVGAGWGAVAFVLDFLKGFAPAFFIPVIFESVFSAESPYLLGLACGCAAIVGHNYSVYLKFQGGKGIATSAGMLAGVVPLAFGLGVSAWLVVFLATRYVSLGSIVAAIVVAAASWALNSSGGITLPILVSAMAAFVILRHHANIRRLASGSENRVTFRKGGKDGS